jgi:hypothetical protein
MGQKSNILTLRSNFLNLSITVYNNKLFVPLHQILENFILSFKIKGAWLFEPILNVHGGSAFLNSTLFYKTNKISFYKKRFCKKKIFVKNSFFTKILNPYISKLNIKNLIFSFRNLNSYINSKFIGFLYSKTNKYIKTIFSRQFNLYLDFLKITSLFFFGKLKSKTFFYFISLIFKNIPKRLHNRFLFFLKNYFNLLIFKIPTIFISLAKPKGLKCIINGRLQGKPRANQMIIVEGSIPNQNFSKNVSLTVLHVYTKLGAFGLKFYSHL